MSQPKILWVQDDLNGPVNGLASYNGENLWFSKVENPLIVSSTDVPVPKVEESSKMSSKSKGKEEVSSNQQEDDESDDDWDESTSEDIPTEVRSFNLYRLTPELFKEVSDNHIAYCLKTRAPLNHGDPTRPKPKVQAVKSSPQEISASLPVGATTVDVEPRLMGKVNDFHHSINPGSVTGQYVTTVKQSDFSNYLIPHRIETN